MPTPAIPDPAFNYMGALFYGAPWESLSRCCICPPDAAFYWEEEGDAGAGTTLLLWREDEREDERPTRWHLSTIFAALEQLYTLRENGLECAASLVLLKQHDNPRRIVPPLNLRLWRTGLCLNSPFEIMQFGSFAALERQLVADDGAEEGGIGSAAWCESRRRPLPHLDAAACEAAAAEWAALVAARVQCLLAAVTDARSYIMLKPLLDEWCFYHYHIGNESCELRRQLQRLREAPWYAEVLRRAPGLAFSH